MLSIIGDTFLHGNINVRNVHRANLEFNQCKSNDRKYNLYYQSIIKWYSLSETFIDYMRKWEGFVENWWLIPNNEGVFH